MFFHGSSLSVQGLSCSTFSLLCLLMFIIQPVVSVTCLRCKDTCPGCAGGAACPLLKTVADNATAVAAATGAAISLVALVPDRILSVFTRPTLEKLAASVARSSRGAAPYDFDGKAAHVIVSAVFDGATTFGEAAPVLLERQATETDKALRENIASALTMLATFDKVKTSTRAGSLGYHLLMWAAISGFVMSSDDRVVTAGTNSGDLSDSGGRVPSTSSKLKHPKTEAQFFEMIHWFQLILHATGVSDIGVTAPFLADVVFRSIRSQRLSWELSYELLIVYLGHVELAASPSVHLGNIYNSGGQDTKIREAEEKLRDHYGASFRGGRVEPRDQEKGGAKEWNNKFNTSSDARPCAAYNNNNKHRAESLDKSGTCKFAHICNHWISTGGPGGMCRGSHSWKQCDHPDKCSTKVA